MNFFLDKNLEFWFIVINFVTEKKLSLTVKVRKFMEKSNERVFSPVRESAISHWVDIVNAVFAAELELSGRIDLNGKLSRGEIDGDEYCRLIAEEIVSRTSDEELEMFVED